MKRIGLANDGISFALAALLALALPVAVRAQDAARAQEQTYKFEIAAQSLGDALRAFGRSSHQQIIFSEAAVRGKRSSAVVGDFTPTQALDLLLTGSGLKVARTAAGVIYVGTSQEDVQSQDVNAQLSEVVVTGSRIRRSDTTTAGPVTVLNPQAFTDFGYTTAGPLLNEVTANAPEFPTPPFQGVPVFNAGRTSPNLFGLGPGRTLSLLNGRRMVTSGSGVLDRSVDTNVIPVGLIERVDVVEGSGSAVYGSDAIAGVVNYVLKTHFEGLELDAQDGISTRGDNAQPALRATLGKNFDSGRGNIAGDFEWSKTQPLLQADRPWTAANWEEVNNPAYTGPNSGQPALIYIPNARFWGDNQNGVILTGNTRSPSGLVQSASGPLQFAPNGQSVIPYNPGTIIGGGGIAEGGQGFPFSDLSSLAAGVTRLTGSIIGHYDFTSHITASNEFLYSREASDDPYGTQSILAFGGGDAASGMAPVPFTNTNPFLTSSELTALSAASPAFAAGQPLYLSKFLNDLPSRAQTSGTDTWRELGALNGDFNSFSRDFYWNLSASYAKTNGAQSVWAPYTAHLENALNPTRNAAGQIVCAINAVQVTDPSCVPLNPFTQTPAPAAAAYVSVLSGQDYHNIQQDYLATLGGDIVSLPAGKAKFSLAYEHRFESARFLPYEADVLGLTFSGIPTPAESGAYKTNEYSGELLIPLLGDALSLPLVKKLEVSGSYRIVENSLAGHENVWGSGLRWEVGYGLTLRASRSRNFSAPTLDEQFAPPSHSISFIGLDPCDAGQINGGPNPAIRLANCKALFAAHPEWGPLSSFHDPAENSSITLVATGGNPDLQNEVSNTTTFGLLFQPDYINGLTAAVDFLMIDLTQAISEFQPASFLGLCYDSSPQPAAACGTFTRDSHGFVATATDEYFNAGFTKFHGEQYNVTYLFPLDRVFKIERGGSIELNTEATHTRLMETSVTGFDLTHSEGTVASPQWRVRFDARYSRGPFRLFYSVYYLPRTKTGYYDTYQTTQYPWVAQNFDQTISVQYDLGPHYTLRAGVNNLTDRGPSFPSLTYGDIYGRQFFLGVRAKL